MKEKEPCLWEWLTVNEMRAVLKRTKTAILPLGVTEQHGYHLPLCTDTVDVFEMAKRISAVTGAVVAPALPYSYSGGELPGTINVSPLVMALMVQEIVTEIIRNGFKHVILLLGHGGSENFMALKEALNAYLRKPNLPADIVLAFAPVWQFSTTWMKHFRAHDFHAGWVETSLILALVPGVVRPRRIKDAPAVSRDLIRHPDNYQVVETLVPSPHVIQRVRQRPDMAVGVMGFPEKANAALGRRVAAESVAGVARLIRTIETKKFKSYKMVKVKRDKLVIA